VHKSTLYPAVSGLRLLFIPAFAPLAAVVDSVDKIPEGMSDYYVETDGKFVLDLEGAHPSSNAKVKEFRDNNIKLTKAMDDMKAKLATLEGVDPAEHKEMQTELDALRDKKLLDEGKVEELLAQRTDRMRSDHKSQIDALTSAGSTLEAERDTLKGRLREVLIDNEISTAVLAVGSVRKGAMTDVLSRAKTVWDLGEDGKPFAKNSDGSARFGKDGRSPMTVTEYAEELAQDAPYLFEGSAGGGGNGNDRNSTTHDGKQIHGSDQRAFSTNLVDIAKGKVRVVPAA